MRAKNAQYLAANLVVVWPAILVYWFGPHYQWFLMPGTKWALLIMASVFTVRGIWTHIVFGDQREKVTKGWMAYQGLQSLWAQAASQWNRFIRPGAPAPPAIDPAQRSRERTAFGFLAVKLFYIPFITNGLLKCIANGVFHWQRVDLIDFSMKTFNDGWYSFVLAVLYGVDALLFWVGYQLESKRLGNVVRSVEPTLLGWAVTMCCYPPFSALPNKVIGLPFDENRLFEGNEAATFYMRLIFVFWSVIFVWASVALGWKCSNLTNRGTISHGPYAFVRHPAYVAKIASWLTLLVPVMTWEVAASLVGWSVVYYLRAMTEEDHMSLDPEYLLYKQRVKYRFIPGLV